MWWRSRSYEVLPALSIRAGELRRSLRLVTICWMFGITWSTCISGSWMNTFRRMLGFNDLHFGLMQALPFVAALGQLIAAILIEQTGLRKYLFIYCMGLARALWLVVAVILVSLPPGPLAIWSVLAVLTASWFLTALASPAWFTWMGDLIPRRVRGRYLATRSLVTRLVQFPTVVFLAIVMDLVIDDHLPVTPDAQPRVLWAISLLFVAAAVFGTTDILLFARIREVMPTTPEQPREPAIRIDVARPGRLGILAAVAFGLRYAWAAVDEILIGSMKDRVFRRYVLFGATIMFAMTVPGPFFLRNMRENLLFSHFSINLMFMVIAPLVGILALKSWGRMIDHWGRRPVLMLATAITITGVFPHFLASKETPNPQFVVDALNGLAGWLGPLVGRPDWRWVSPTAPVGAWLVVSACVLSGGIGWTGVMLGNNGVVLGFSDGAGRTKHVAAQAVLLGVGGALGGVVGGLVAKYVGEAAWYAPLKVGPFEWNNWHATFALSLLARVAALLLLIGMPDPGSGRTRDMIRHITVEMYNLLGARLLFPWRMGRDRRRRNGPDVADEDPDPRAGGARSRS